MAVWRRSWACLGAVVGAEDGKKMSSIIDMALLGPVSWLPRGGKSKKGIFLKQGKNFTNSNCDKNLET